MAHLEIAAFVLSAFIWLMPMFLAFKMRKIRLLHPSFVVPGIMIYLAAVPLLYSLINGQRMLKTASLSFNTDFLFEPYLTLSLAGIFYHLGVKFSGISLIPEKQDQADYFAQLKTIRNAPGIAVFLGSVILLLLSTASILFIKSYGHIAKGFFWMLCLYRSFYALPILVLNQNRSFGVIFLLLTLPVTLFTTSKSAFMYLSISLFLFYQDRLLKVSKIGAVVAISCLLLTPVAVARYTKTAVGVDQGAIGASAWNTAIDRISHREYAFEAFACVNNTQEKEPLHWGAKTLQEFTHMIPSVLWPGKPVIVLDFPSTYLFADVRQTDEWVGYTGHIFSPLYLDFGIAGVCIGTMFIGLIYGSFYKWGRLKSIERGEAWPLILYHSFAVQTHWILGAGIAYGIPMAMGSITGVALSLFFALLFTPRR